MAMHTVLQYMQGNSIINTVDVWLIIVEELEDMDRLNHVRKPDSSGWEFTLICTNNKILAFIIWDFASCFEGKQMKRRAYE